MIRRLLTKLPYTMRLLICFFAFASIFLVIFSVLLYYSYRTSGTRLVQGYNQKVINQILQNYNMIDDTITNLLSCKYAQADVTKLIYQDHISEFDKNAIISRLRNEISSYPMYHSAVIYNNQSNEWYLLDSSESQVTKIIDNFYKGDSIPKARTVPIEITRANGEKELVFSYYMYDYVTEASVMNGGFVLNISTSWILALLKSSELENINFIIVDSDGKVILDSSGKIAYQTVLERSYLTSVLDGHTQNSFTCDVDNIKTVVSTLIMPKTGWILVCEQPFSSFSDLLLPMQISTVLLTLALIVLAFLGALMISRYLYRPVRNLVVQAQNITDDEFSGKDEFGYLMRALHSGIEQSSKIEEHKRSISEIKRHNYFKLLLEDGCLVEESEEFRDCAEFVRNGQFFAVVLKLKGRLNFNAVCNVWDEWAGPLFRQYETFPMEEQEFVALIKEEDSVNVLRNTFLQQYFGLQQLLSERFGERFSIFVTSYYPPGQMAQLYTQMQRLCKYELMYSVGCCLNEEVLQNNHDAARIEYPQSAANRLLGALRKREMEQAELFLDEFLSKILNHDVDSFRLDLIRLAMSIQNLYEETNLRRNTGTHEKMTDVVQKITQLESMDDVQMCFISMFELMCSPKGDGAAQGEGKRSALVRSVADYIQSSYSDPNLSLEQVSEVFKMSANYLGKLFKEEMGVPVGAYITSVRLNKSLTLLNDTSYSIKEIIEQVGFINESGFYKLFKKQFGITPKEYRVNRVLAENMYRQDNL